MKNTVTKIDMARAIAQSNEITITHASKLLDQIVFLMTKALESGKRVYLPNFGRFDIVERKARNAHNPKNPSQKVVVPKKKVPRFKAFSLLKEKVNH